jgi:putative CocE/NonD family hydrolase
MSLLSHAVQHYLRLPAPDTRSLRIQRDLGVPMRDGAVLLADHWAPRHGARGLPTALVRTPYERRGLLGRLLARPLAERGFQVLAVATRDSWGPGDTADPYRRDRDDGLDIVDWILHQPWFGGSLVLAGPSHPGCTQWSVAADAPPRSRPWSRSPPNRR